MKRNERTRCAEEPPFYDAFPQDPFPGRFFRGRRGLVPYVTEMAQQFNATVTVLNAFNVVPDYMLAPRLDGSGESEPAAVPYTPAFRELRKQRE